MNEPLSALRQNFFDIARQIGPLSPLTLDRYLFAQSLILLGEISRTEEGIDWFCEESLTEEEKATLFSYASKAVIVFEVLIRRGSELEDFTNSPNVRQILIGIVYFRIEIFPEYTKTPRLISALMQRMRAYAILIFVIDVEIAFKLAVKRHREMLFEQGTPPEPDEYLDSLLVPQQLDRQFILNEYSLTD